jgi:hypothetical protein
MPDWIPISPTLTPAGAFAALSSLPNAATLTPVPLAGGQESFGTFRETEQVVDFSMAAQLGVATAFDVSTALKTKTIAYDVAVYSEAVTTTPPGGLILGTWWGAGIRTRIDVTNFNAKVNLSLGAVAAAASIGLVDASYTIEGIGVADPAVLALLPGPGRFDDQAYKQILACVAKVKADYLVPQKGITSVPFMILVSNPGQTFAAPLDRARAQLFAVRRLRDGIPEAKAISGAGAAGLDAIAVQDLYRQWAGLAAGATPSSAARDWAQNWLDSIDLG